MAYVFKTNMVATSKYSIKCPYSMTPIGICIHNTSNNASAENEIKYMISNNNQTSFHYAVDEKEVIQGLPTNRNAWAAGDGANGNGNRKYIHIEICRSTGDLETFKKCEANAAAFVAKLLKEKGWTTANVKQHYDFSKKNCPHKTRQLGWDRFVKMIQKELDILNGKTTTTTSKPTTSTNTSFKVGNYNANVKTTEALNIRSKRNASSSKVGTLPKGTVVQVDYIMYQDNSVAKKGSMWGSVYTKYGDGFINMHYTTPTTSASTASKTTTSTTGKTVNYRVEITASSLNVRKGAGTSYAVTGCVKKGQVFTIVEEKNGWGKLKSGAGWINLSYTKKL